MDDEQTQLLRQINDRMHQQEVDEYRKHMFDPDPGSRAAEGKGMGVLGVSMVAIVVLPAAILGF